MTLTDLTSTLAAVLTTASFLPQAWPIVIANCVTQALASAILVMKLRYRRQIRPPVGRVSTRLQLFP